VAIVLEKLGRYQILGELGRGGCGVVYRALDPGIGRAVAIKTILADAHSPAGMALRERFRREARSAGNLSHPNIVTIHEFNDSGEIMFIAMELIQGQTLAEKMAESSPLPLNLMLAVMSSAADALDYAHANGIVHRDVKPANFMLAASGQVKVTDFGIAKMLDDDIGLTNTGMVVGTVQYMSPEQIAAKPASARSDQFSLGVIAYEMLTGQKPFQGNSWASVMNQIMSVEPPPVKQHRQDLGDEVTVVLRRALAKDPEARYSSCREFADDLAKAVTGVTMQRTAPVPIGEALTGPLPPPRKDALPETQAMVSMTAIPAQPDASPDTGQKMTPTSRTIPASDAAAKIMAEEQTGKRRPVLSPILMGAAAVVVVAAVWWRFSAQPVSTTPSAAPAVATTTPPAPAVPVTIPPAEQSVASQPPSPKKETAKEAAQRPPASKSAAAAAPSTARALPAAAPPVSVAAIPAPVPVPAAVPAPVPPTVTVAPPVTASTPQVATSPEPAATPAPVPPPAPKPAPVQSSPTPAAAAAPSTPNPEIAANAARAEEQRKAAELSAARKAVDEALNRYRTAFENKDSEGLKSIWPGLGRSELAAFQNFFKIARSIKLQLRPLGEAEISSTGATIRARRTMAATDERGALPTQDQTVSIHLRHAVNGMVIESIDIAGK